MRKHDARALRILGAFSFAPCITGDSGARSHCWRRHLPSAGRLNHLIIYIWTVGERPFLIRQMPGGRQRRIIVQDRHCSWQPQKK